MSFMAYSLGSKGLREKAAGRNRAARQSQSQSWCRCRHALTCSSTASRLKLMLLSIGIPRSHLANPAAISPAATWAA